MSTKKETKEMKLFSVIFSYILEEFNIAVTSLCRNTNLNEDSVYSWRTRCAPGKEKFKELKIAIGTQLTLKGNLENQNLIKYMDALFNSYGLSDEWLAIKKNDQSTCKDLIIATLNLGHKYKNLTTATSMLESIPKEENKIKKLVAFDLDGTLIKGIKYSWNLLYQAVNISNDFCKINKRKFENGQISYPEWVGIDCNMLQKYGLTKEIAENAIRQTCTLTKNFYEAINKLKEAGCAVGIISGGADIVLHTMIPDADKIFDNNIYINKMKFDKKSGELDDIEATAYDWDDDGKVRGVAGKGEALKLMCKKYHISLNDSVFVGDDDNDFKAMKMAGMKILYYSGFPGDKILGRGSRKIPEGIHIVINNDLMEVADHILNNMQEAE